MKQKDLLENDSREMLKIHRLCAPSELAKSA